MRIVEPTIRYMKGRKKCEKRGLNMELLDSVIYILTTRPFTKDEIVKYKVHNLSGKYKGCQELHLGGRSSDWLLVFKITGNSVRFEDTYVVLKNTGTHDECLGDDQISNELIFI